MWFVQGLKQVIATIYHTVRIRDIRLETNDDGILRLRNIDDTDYALLDIAGLLIGGSAAYKYAILRDEKSSGTNGGSSTTTTWVQRDLNTEDDPDNIVSISSNQFTPISGTYLCLAWCPFAAPVGTAIQGVNRIYNVTATTEIAKSSTVRCVSDTGAMSLAAGIFTANGTDAYRIDTYVTSGRATTGLGSAAGTGTNEVYTTIFLFKIA